jgi:hypothetical protein
VAQGDGDAVSAPHAAFGVLAATGVVGSSVVAAHPESVATGCPASLRTAAPPPLAEVVRDAAAVDAGKLVAREAAAPLLNRRTIEQATAPSLVPSIEVPRRDRWRDIRNPSGFVAPDTE